jgi:hypothetical protein
MSIAPEKRLALASVMMKALTPLRAMTKPLSQEAELRGNSAQVEAPTRRHFAHGSVGHAYPPRTVAPVRPPLVLAET